MHVYNMTPEDVFDLGIRYNGEVLFSVGKPDWKDPFATFFSVPASRLHELLTGTKKTIQIKQMPEGAPCFLSFADKVATLSWKIGPFAGRTLTIGVVPLFSNPEFLRGLTTNWSGLYLPTWKLGSINQKIYSSQLELHRSIKVSPETFLFEFQFNNYAPEYSAFYPNLRNFLRSSPSTLPLRGGRVIGSSNSLHESLNPALPKIRDGRFEDYFLYRSDDGILNILRQSDGVSVGATRLAYMEFLDFRDRMISEFKKRGLEY